MISDKEKATYSWEEKCNSHKMDIMGFSPKIFSP